MLAGNALTGRESVAFERLFSASEDWIVDRVIAYATELGYAKYASPVREAWHVAVRGLTQSLIEAVKGANGNLDIRAEERVAEDPALSFGVKEAGLHRSRGVDFGMFLGLMKYNEQAFIDYLEEREADPVLRVRFQWVVRRFFDRVEIGFCTQWSGLGAEAAIAELQEGNVRMTGEKDTYLRLFEAVNVPVILLDSDGCIENINERAAVEFGIEGVEGSAYYSRAGVGLPFRPLGDDVARFIGGDDTGLLYERSVETALGSRHYVIRIQRLVDVTGDCTHVVVVMSDMTERRELQLGLERLVEDRTDALRQTNEELLQANQVKNEFLASMSHEFRTPLNSIIGFSSLMLGGLTGPVNEEQRRQLGMIASAGEHLLHLVNDLLDLSRIEAGRLEVVPTEFEITTLCHSLAEMMRPLATEKGVALECGDDCDEVVMCTDRDKVTQILLNLVSNAVKFTVEGRVVLTCALGDGDGTVRLSVQDTGCGVAAAEIDGIFDEFRRSGSGFAPSEGSGLGLAISRRLARALGGDIKVESAVGVGSVFCLVLPRVVEAREASATPGA
jgi:signal transduction histidine kinase